MSKVIAARRYAEALFQLGNEKDTIDQLLESLRVVHDVFKNEGELDNFLKHPRISSEKKKQFIEDVFEGINQDILNTLKLLIERERTEIIPSIIDHFVHLVNDAEGIAEVKVFSVRKLSETEEDSLSKHLMKRLEKKVVHINNIIDPSLIGGLKIQVGNTLYDGSIKNKLKRIEQKIMAANE